MLSVRCARRQATLLSQAGRLRATPTAVARLAQSSRQSTRQFTSDSDYEPSESSDSSDGTVVLPDASTLLRPKLVTRSGTERELQGVWVGLDGKEEMVNEQEWRQRYHEMDRQLGELTPRDRRLISGDTMGMHLVEETVDTHGVSSLQEFLENPWREDHPIHAVKNAIRVKPWELRLPMDKDMGPMKGTSELRFRPFHQSEMEALYTEAIHSLPNHMAESNDRKYMLGFEDTLLMNDSSASDSLPDWEKENEDLEVDSDKAWLWRYAELFEEHPVDRATQLGVNLVRHPDWDSPWYGLQPDFSLSAGQPRGPRRFGLKPYLGAGAGAPAFSGGIGEVDDEELFDFEPYVGAETSEEILDSEAEFTAMEEPTDADAEEMDSELDLDSEAYLERRMQEGGGREAQQEEAEETPAELEGTDSDVEFKSMYRGRKVDVLGVADESSVGVARLLLRSRLLEQDPTMFDMPSFEEMAAMQLRKILHPLEEARSNFKDPKMEEKRHAAQNRKTYSSDLSGETLSPHDLHFQQQTLDAANEFDYIKSDPDEDAPTASDDHPDDWWGYPTTSYNLDVLNEDIEIRARNYYYDDAEDHLLRAHLDPGQVSQTTADMWEPELVRGDLSRRTRRAIYKYHVLDPVKWSPRKLSEMFGINLNYIHGVLNLEAIKERLTARGFPIVRSEFLEFMASDLYDMPTHDIAPYIREAWKDFEAVEHDIIEQDLVDFVWTPDLQANRRHWEDVRFEDEYVTMELENQERARHQRWLSRRERFQLSEQRKFAFQGPVGSSAPANYQPQLLDENLRRPSRHKTMLVDYSDLKNANYRVAVQDRAGRVREPNVTEYEWIRKRERNRHSRFNYVKWNQHRKFYPESSMTKNTVPSSGL